MCYNGLRTRTNDHVHVINEGKHGHTHSVEELEIALGHRGAL